MNQYQTFNEAMTGLRERGYTADFSTDTDCLYCGDLDIRLNPEEFHVDEVYRFAGDSNLDENSVVFAITSSTGVKGTVVDILPVLP